ncbi:MAG TPA: hypothetical protein PK997_05310 [Candidatus Omnitrophota bacterium]|nr:hypothetical protein [Candidatus Omnitrophota bacterium]
MVCEALGVEITLASVGGAHAVFPEEMPPGDFVIINVSGHERYRGPALVFYAELIKEIAQRLGCFIMDELGGTHMPAIKEMTRGTDNVYYAERDFSIWELAGLASKARGYLGADSGISHLMGGLTNAIVFFGDQTSEIWRPYVPSGYEKCEYKEGFILERSVDPSGFLKAVIYQPVRCRPCFDWGCRRPVCVDAFLAVKEPLINVVLELFRSCGAIPGAVDL